jgi:hypothetical protein
MDTVKKYVSQIHPVNLNEIDDIVSDFPEIKKIIDNNNNDFGKICSVIDNSAYSNKEKEQIKGLFLYFNNLRIESGTYKCLTFQNFQKVNDLLKVLEQREKELKFLREHAEKTTEGKELSDKLKKKTDDEIDIMIKTNNNKPISEYRNFSIKNALIENKKIDDQILLRDDLKGILKNKKKKDIEAISIVNNRNHK